MKSVRLGKSQEEKTAEKITQEMTNFSLDLEAVGMYLSKQPYILYSRTIEVLEAAEYSKTENKYDERFNEYNDDIHK